MTHDRQIVCCNGPDRHQMWALCTLRKTELDHSLYSKYQIKPSLSEQVYSTKCKMTHARQIVYCNDINRYRKWAPFVPLEYTEGTPKMR